METRNYLSEVIIHCCCVPFPLPYKAFIASYADSMFATGAALPSKDAKKGIY